MHQEDRMTPKERLTNFMAGKEIDRIPILPILSNVVPRFINMNLHDIRAHPQNEAQSQIAAYHLLGHDSLASDYGLHGIGIALGSKVNNPAEAVPAIDTYVLTDLKDLHLLDPEKVSRKYDAKFARQYEAVEIMLEAVGNECGVMANLPGPLSAAASVCPTDKILRATLKDAEGLHQLLRFCTDCIARVIKEYAALGIGFAIGDPVASGSVLKFKDYETFVKPYMTEIVQYIHSLDATVGYHICGNTMNRLESMASTGVDFLSLDTQVDLQVAKESVGHSVGIMGNVDPSAIMTLGTTEEVSLAVKSCVQKAIDSPKGFILSTGCDLPYNASLENLQTFMAAGRKYGKWPANPELYQ